MPNLPERPNLDHLRKQAKELLRAYRAGDARTITRLRTGLPHATPELRLRDAQSCVAREYGFASWPELVAYVEARSHAHADLATRRRAWLTLVYANDITGGFALPRPALAARMLAEQPDLVGDDPHLACAVGDVRLVRHAIGTDPGWINRPGGVLRLPPLVAVTHSALARLAEWRPRLLATARLLLAGGADPNQRIGSRFPPGSLAAPDDGNPLSALYGAAGRNHDPEMTALLLAAGADPNDNESLYHSLESPDCTRLLLQHGARIAGSNAMYRALDLADAAPLELLLAHGGDPNEPAPGKPASGGQLADWGAPLLWAIRRRRSTRHVRALLAAGADPGARRPDGIGAYRLARQFGLDDIAALLATEPLDVAEQFVAACARGDVAAARRIQTAHATLPAALSPVQLRLLPELSAAGAGDAVRSMVALGWPIAVRGGDWDASALNHAVFRGDAALADFLLAHGASWREAHGYGSDVAGTLSWASCNEPVPDGDWPACARVLRARGMPRALPDAAGLLLDGRRMQFSDEVAEMLLAT
jgi:hypothetical protein